MSSSIGCTVAAFNGAKYAAPYVKNSLNQNSQDAVNVFFGGSNPEVQFQRESYGQTTGPTTAFSTTVEARRWDHVVNSFLIMEKMHDHQQFPLLLAPLELAKGMTFTTRVFTSNLDPPEEAPEHVPAPFSTTQWSETKTALTMVHRSVKFSLHELKTEKGQQDYKVHLSNLALMFLRDTHNVVLRKFARQNTLIQALMSFFPPNKRMHKELMHNSIRSFGSLNVNPAGLDAMVANVKQVGTTQNVDFDTCVVPYGSLSNLALSRNNFILTDLAITLSRDLAKMADINHPTKIPTYVFQNDFNVFQYQKNADQIQNPQNDPLSNVAAVATYHPFGNDVAFMPGARDIQVVSANANGWATLKLSEAVEYLNLPGDYVLEKSPADIFTGKSSFEKRSNINPIFKTREGTVSCLYGQVECLWASRATVRSILMGLPSLPILMRFFRTCVGMANTRIGDKKIESFLGTFPNKSTEFASFKPIAEKVKVLADLLTTYCPFFSRALISFEDALSLTEEDKYSLGLFSLLPLTKASVQLQLESGIPFPFEVAAVRPFIELETANAIFCKRGRETAVTYCLPPWTFIGRDNRIEMVDMKFGFWRECHIERPANILVAEHAFVTRVRNGMDTTWMCECDYLQDPMNAHNKGDVYPIITGTINPCHEWPNLAAISHNIIDHDIRQTYAALDGDLKDFNNEIHDMNKSGLFDESTACSPTLWQGESLTAGAIPRICALGTTRQMEVIMTGEGDKKNAIQCKPGRIFKNAGHMKELDSVEWIGSLCGFAQSQLAPPSSFF